jgi:hypothetical protein
MHCDNRALAVYFKQKQNFTMAIKQSFCLLLVSLLFLAGGSDAFWSSPGSGATFLSRQHMARSAGGDERHSFVEGENFSDRFAEVESMGGDSFFLTSDDSELEEVDDTFTSNMATASGGGDDAMSAIGNTVEERYYATDGKGPAPSKYNVQPKEDGKKWEWDGTVDEDAHMDLGW